MSICRQLDVDPAVGLSAAEVLQRRQQFGPNKLAEEAKEPGWRAFLRQYRDLMQLVLLGAAIVSIVALQDFSTGLVVIALTVVTEKIIKIVCALKNLKHLKIGLYFIKNNKDLICCDILKNVESKVLKTLDIEGMGNLSLNYIKNNFQSKFKYLKELYQINTDQCDKGIINEFLKVGVNLSLSMISIVNIDTLKKYKEFRRV